MDYNERSAYPHPDEFKVMRPEYTELEDGYFQAAITIAPFKVVGKSTTMPGARRAAIYDAAHTYRSYHPSYRIVNPYPKAFMDQEQVKWKELSGIKKERNGDYAFYDEDGDEDFANIDQMLVWDVRPASVAAE
jgi:hypothetical protein